MIWNVSSAVHIQLTESSRDKSAEEGYVEARSRKKKRRSKNAPFKAPSLSVFYVFVALPASETEEGNTKHIAQKQFLSKGVKAKSGEDILLIGIKTTEKVVKEGNTHFGRVFSDKL